MFQFNDEFIFKTAVVWGVALWSHRFVTVFLRNILTSSSGFTLTLTVKALCSSKTLGTI
jgi:hypothetical protein